VIFPILLWNSAGLSRGALKFFQGQIKYSSWMLNLQIYGLFSHQWSCSLLSEYFPIPCFNEQRKPWERQNCTHQIPYGVNGVWTSDFKGIKTVKANTCSVTHWLWYKCCTLSKHNKLNCLYFKMYITSGKEKYKVYRLFPAIEQLQIG
jgi:hypothetical protein